MYLRLPPATCVKSRSPSQAKAKRQRRCVHDSDSVVFFDPGADPKSIRHAERSLGRRFATATWTLQSLDRFFINKPARTRT